MPREIEIFLYELLNQGAVWGIVGIIAFFVFIGLLKSFIRVTLPNKILVITGRRRVKAGRKFGFSVEKGRTTMWPYIQQVGYLDLGVLPINVRVDGVNSANGITVGADATACVCIDNDNEAMLYSAVERLMGKSRGEIHEQIQSTLVGNFRGALNKATPLQAIGMEDVPDELLSDDKEQTDDTKEDGDRGAVITGERAQFRNELLKDINSDLSSFGMKVVSVSLQKIWDSSNYIANLAQKTLAQKRQQVEIEEARLRAKAMKAESDSERRISIAKSKADEKIVATKEKLEVYRQESNALIEKAKLLADNEIFEAENRGEKDVQELTVEFNKLKNISNIILEEEANQRSAEIISEGEKEATNILEQTRNDILKQKVDILANSGDGGKTVLFIQQQLPHLFEEYKKYAEGLYVDSYVIMDDKQGFNGAVNKGPAAFVNFLKHFEEALGISVKELMGKETKEVE
jgi:flotillin